LELLYKEIDSNKSYLTRQTEEEYLEEKEDYLIALARLSKSEKKYTLEEVEREIDLEY